MRKGSLMLESENSQVLSPEGGIPGSERGGVWVSRLLDPEELGPPLLTLRTPDAWGKQVGIRPPAPPTPSCPLVVATLLHTPEDRLDSAVYFWIINPFQPLGLPSRSTSWCPVGRKERRFR